MTVFNQIQLVLMLFLIFCFKNKIKLIYSATSASLGNKGKDKNLSPYAFTKAKNLEFLENLKNGLILNMRSYFFTMFMDQDKSPKEKWRQLLEYLKDVLKIINPYL